MQYRETSGLFDQASMSDASQSEFDKMLDLMHMIMREKQEIAHQLEQAHQQIRKLTEERDNLRNTTRELTTRWQRTLREKNDLARQLKQACLEGEASSPSAKLEELTRESMRNWFVRECQN